MDKRKDKKGRVLRNGETQRADGKYMFRYTDVDGARKTVYSWKLVDTDKVPEGKRCSIALRDIEKRVSKDLLDGINGTNAKLISIDDLFEAFMERRKDLAISTRVGYNFQYDMHVRQAIGYKKVGSVKHSDIQSFCLSLMEESNLKLSSIQQIHGVLFQLFESAVMDNLIRTNPAQNALIGLRKNNTRGKKIRHALTQQEQECFVNYIYTTENCRMWRPLFTVLLGTGMRIGEALGLRWCDCDFEEDLIYVTHALLYKYNEQGKYEYRISNPKTEAGKRIIPMLSEVKDVLLKEKERLDQINYEPFVVDGYTGFIFLNTRGKVFTQGAVFAAIRQIVDSYNRHEFFEAQEENRPPCYLPPISAHIFRHTFCTRMCEQVHDLKVIQDVMGHQDIQTTMNIYNDATIKQKKITFETLEGKLKLN